MVKWSILVAAVFLLLVPVVSWASYQRFDDFEDESIAPIGGQDGWVAGGVENRVVIDPADSANQVLYVPSSSSTIHKSLLPDGLGVADGTARMLFLRLRVSNKQTFSVGLSHLAGPYEFSDFAPEIGMANSAQNLDLRVWDDDIGTYQMVTQLQADTWYNLWVFVDSLNNNSQVWLNNTPGAAAGPADKLAAPDGDETFEFRAGKYSLLRSFYIKTAGGSSGVNLGPVYFDDIYLEVADGLNLSNPTVPVGDFNDDGHVDVVDLLIFVEAFGSTDGDPNYNSACDLAPDGSIDVVDLLIFVDNFGAW